MAGSSVLHDVTDVELDLLYRKCLLTMFPSFAEGWGLPVGESLAYGKISIASRAGAIPEVGGELSDYINPYNACDGLELLLRYLDDPELRRSREREIVCRFEPRSWRRVAKDFLKSAQSVSASGPTIRRRCGDQAAGEPISADQQRRGSDFSGPHEWGAIRGSDLHFRLATAREFGACGRTSRQPSSDSAPMSRQGPRYTW